MGKGDRRTRRGKIWRHTYGNTRPKPDKKKKVLTPGEAGLQAKVVPFAKKGATGSEAKPGE